MAGIQLPGQFTSQPQYPAPLDTSGYARNAAFGWNPGAGSMTKMVMGRDLTLTGLPSLSVGAKGKAVVMTTGQYLSRANYAPVVTSDGVGTGDFSILLLSRPVAEAVVSAHAQISQRQEASPYSQFSMQANAGAGGSMASGSFAFSTYSTAMTECVVPSMVDGKYHVWVMVRARDTIYAYRDGIQVATVTGTVRSIHTASSALGIGVAPSSFNARGGEFACALGVNRAWSAREVVDLSLNVWAAFKAPDRPSMFSDTAAAPSGYKPYWSSQRPRIYGAGVR